MASTPCSAIRPSTETLTAFMTADGGTGTPNIAGYACDDSTGPQRWIVPEALVGQFYVELKNSVGDVAGAWSIIMDDDTNDHRAEDSIAAITAATQATAAALDASRIPRAASPTTPGAPQAMHLENASGDTLASAREVHDGDAA